MHAEPLQVNFQPVGVLVLYSAGFDAINPPGSLASTMGLLRGALTGYSTAHPHEDRPIRLQKELHNRQLLGHAMRVLMARHQVTKA